MGNPVRRILLCCATARGERVLERLAAIATNDVVTVASFRENAAEPPYLDRIRALAESHNWLFQETRNLAAAEAAHLWAPSPDLVLMVHWRYLVPIDLLRRARLGAFVFHDSLLPAYRGFAPSVWALINGERELGATLVHAAEEVDAGDIVDQMAIPVGPEETIADVFDRITDVYLQLLERNWRALRSGTAARRPQDESRATFTCKRLPDDARIDWTAPSRRILDLVRASTRPYSGAFTYLGGRRVTIWSAHRGPNDRRYVGTVPGRVVRMLPMGVEVLTGDGSILVDRIQFDGEPETTASTAIASITATFHG